METRRQSLQSPTREAGPGRPVPFPASAPALPYIHVPNSKSGISQLMQLNGQPRSYQSAYLPSGLGEFHGQSGTAPTATDYFEYFNSGSSGQLLDSGNSYHAFCIPKFGFMSPRILAPLPNPVSTSPPGLSDLNSGLFSPCTSSFSSGWSSSLDTLTFSTSPSSDGSEAASSLPSYEYANSPDFKKFLDQDDLASLSSPMAALPLAHATVLPTSPHSPEPTSTKQEELPWEGLHLPLEHDLEHHVDLLSGFSMTGRPISDIAEDAYSPNSLEELIEEEKPACRRAPLARSYKTISPKSKQLGSLPADGAFATSLGQLSPAEGNGKPPYLWWTLIRAAILGAPEGKLQMETLCSEIMEKYPYFGTAKEAKNWKSSIRSVIHTKPCFYKSEDKAKNVWWHVDVNIDPREQRRGMKKRNSMGETKRPTNLHSARRASTATTCSTEEEEGDADAVTDEEYEEARIQSIAMNRKRRKTG